jgi:hypothetical protein
MKLLHKGTSVRVRPGDVVRTTDTGQYVTVAGWDPTTLYVHAWAGAADVGDMRRHEPWSAHFLNMIWVDD